MAQLLYCWRCKMEVLMLDESEWDLVSPLLSNSIEEVKHFREAHSMSLAEAKTQAHGKAALAEYYRLTRLRETNVDVLWHHRLSIYGPICNVCSKPLRTPQAKYCVECGADRPS